jgi:membrane protein DedA with SNARE-associated domain/membrane-associated phospholipid phosphatase
LKGVTHIENAMLELFQDLLIWVAANPGWAHLIVFLVALVESLAIVGLIVPGVIMMTGAGALIAAGALDFWPVCLWAVAGAVTGDGLSYWLGRRFQERLKTLWPFRRYPQSLDTGLRFFEKYGGKSVAFGRFVGPVRAVIPLVAGMMGMPTGRFLLANVLSAILWAPVYLLPGIVFGASLQLAAEAAFHLVLLLLALVTLVWATAWGARQIFLLYSTRARRWVENLLRWAELHPRMGDIARALADPRHPDAGTLAALAGILLLTATLFALVTGFAVAAAPDTPLNRTVLELALSLQTPTANHLMATFSRFGDLAVILPLVLVVTGWLFWRGERGQARYWLAAGGFAILAGPLLEILLQVPRPDIGLTELKRWAAFPSSHTLRATVVYGFLAIALAGGMTPTWRWLPYVWASMIIMAVGISRLYFGVHWLTDVIGSLTLGLAWVAALGLAYRRHAQVNTSWRALGAVALGALTIAFCVQSTVSHGSGVTLYRPEPQAIAISEANWKGTAWSTLPQTRDDLRKAGRHPLNLQYAGALDEFLAQLSNRGWEPGARLGWGTAMKLLSPSLLLADLPVIPHVHRGSYESLTLVKQAPNERRLVLRLWATPYRIDEGIPLWIGNVTTQHKREILNILAIPVTDPDTCGPLESVQDDFSALHPFRPSGTAPILLQAAPP